MGHLRLQAFVTEKMGRWQALAWNRHGPQSHGQPFRTGLPGVFGSLHRTVVFAMREYHSKLSAMRALALPQDGQSRSWYTAPCSSMTRQGTKDRHSRHMPWTVPR
jgi:hypothetical protein